MADSDADRALGLVYDAALGDAAWSQALSSLGAPFGSAVYLVVLNASEGRQDLAATSEAIPGEAEAAYEGYYAALDPRRSLALTLPVGSTMACHEHFAPDFVRQDEFYNDYLRQHGWRFAMAARVLDHRGRTAIVGLQRSERAGPFTAPERTRLERAGRHLGRALTLLGRLEVAEQRAQARQAMLDRLSAPAVLVDAELRVLERNLAAERLFAAGGPPQCRLGRLAVADAAEEARLRWLVRRTAEAAARGEPDGGACRLAQGRDGRVTVRAMPVRAGAAGGDRPAALLLIEGNGCLPGDTALPLRAVFGLTVAEEAVALALLDGLAAREIAERRGASIETVRVQIRAVLAKTGCSRQADLLLRLGAWMAWR
ncbi:MAG: helix-turn-helix transcriptional regulator [Geminicoccaceae bacterium]